MKVGSNTGTNAVFMSMPSNQSGQEDPQIKSIQKQIAGIQEQLQGLNENKNLTAEEKMARRKELQEQLTDLNKQLNQHKIAKMQEKCKKNNAETAETSHKNTPKQKTRSDGMGTGTMQGIISADISMKQVAISNGVRGQMEGKANVLKVELEIDKGRGDSTERKEAELADVEEKINSVSGDIMSNISEITKKLDESGAARAKEENEKSDKTEAKKDNDEELQINTDKEKTAADDVNSNPNLTAGTMETYVPVDVKL